MKLRESNELVRYLEEYLYYGQLLEYFDDKTKNKNKIKILQLDILYDRTLKGDAKLMDDNTLIINPSLFNNSEYATLVLFHEFNHCCNNIHNDLRNLGDKSIIYKMQDYLLKRYNTRFNDNDIITREGDVENPYTYYLFGFSLLDEYCSEYIANEMCNFKYKKNIYLKNDYRNYGNISFKTPIDYYGIAHEIVDEFAKTLFLKEKNARGLCKCIFKDDFIYDLFYQHLEKSESLKYLFDEISFMGVIGFSEEQYNGRLLDREKMSVRFVNNSYQELKYLFKYGYENREMIPYIVVPDELKKVLN